MPMPMMAKQHIWTILLSEPMTARPPSTPMGSPGPTAQIWLLSSVDTTAEATCMAKLETPSATMLPMTCQLGRMVDRRIFMPERLVKKYPMTRQAQVSCPSTVPSAPPNTPSCRMMTSSQLKKIDETHPAAMVSRAHLGEPSVRMKLLSEGPMAVTTNPAMSVPV